MFQIFSDFPFPDRSIYSPEEELFKKQIIKACGIQIRQTLLSKGSAKQAFLYIWADISQHENFIMTSAVKAFFLDAYVQCFRLDRDAYSEIDLNLHDFKENLISYAYGHALGELREILKSDPMWQDNRLCLDYATITFMIFVSDPAIYAHWEKRTNELKLVCFEEMQKHDPYQVLELSDVRLTFILKDAQATKKWNDVFMTNH